MMMMMMMMSDHKGQSITISEAYLGSLAPVPPPLEMKQNNFCTNFNVKLC